MFMILGGEKFSVEPKKIFPRDIRDKTFSESR